MGGHGGAVVGGFVGTPSAQVRCPIVSSSTRSVQAHLPPVFWSTRSVRKRDPPVRWSTASARGRTDGVIYRLWIVEIPRGIRRSWDSLILS